MIRKSGYNNLTIAIFERFTTTRRTSANELQNARVLGHDTFFPGGLYGSAQIFIPRDVTRGFLWRGGDRLEIRNGLTVVYEGEIIGINYQVGGGAEQGLLIECAGFWGSLLGKLTWDKRWADIRLDDTTWRWRTTANGAEYFVADRLNRIRQTPKGVAFPNNTYSACDYTMPTGETIKRVTLNYDMQEGGQAWNLRMRDDVGATNIFSITTSGTGSRDDTLGTPRQALSIQFGSNAAQTPTEDGVYYGQISNVTVYSETGNINLTEIAKDVRGKVTNLNSDESNIDSNTFSLVPFLTSGPEPMTSILSRAAAYGDSSFNSWSCYLRESDAAASPDGKPVLFVKQYPALTDYDYAIRLDDANLVPPLEIVRDFDGIANYMIVRYRDAENNRDVIVTPDDDANLKDTTSITAYGERHAIVDAGQATATTAKNIARRILAARKNPQFYVAGPITVRGFIRAKSGQPIPAANIQAGKRIKIENFLEDLAAVSDAGLTFIVTGTQYRDDDETCSISTGRPDNLAVYLAQRQLLDDRLLTMEGSGRR